MPGNAHVGTTSIRAFTVAPWSASRLRCRPVPLDEETIAAAGQLLRDRPGGTIVAGLAKWVEKGYVLALVEDGPFIFRTESGGMPWPASILTVHAGPEAQYTALGTLYSMRHPRGVVPLYELSAETYAHALRELDPTDPGEVFSFCDNGGLPCLPVCSSKRRMLDSRACARASNGPEAYCEVWGGTNRRDTASVLADATCSVLDEWLWRAGRVPYDSLSQSSIPNKNEQVQAVILSEFVRRMVMGDAPGGVVSMAEASICLTALQASSTALVAGAACDDGSVSLKDVQKWRACVGLNDLACEVSQTWGSTHARKLVDGFLYDARNFVSNCIFDNLSMPPNHDDDLYMVDPPRATYVTLYETLVEGWCLDRYLEGNLAGGICAQLIEAIESPDPWKRCADPTCGIWFKTKATDLASDRKKRSDARFCCQEHADRARNALYAREDRLIKATLARHSWDIRAIDSVVAETEAALSDEGYLSSSASEKGRSSFDSIERSRDRWSMKIDRALEQHHQSKREE